MVCGSTFTAQGGRRTCSNMCKNVLRERDFPLVPEHPCANADCPAIIPSRRSRRTKRFCSKKCASRQRNKDKKVTFRVKEDGYVTVSGGNSKEHPAYPGTGRHFYYHVMVAYDRYGMGPHTCFWCKCRIDWLFKQKQVAGAVKKIAVDHLDWNTQNNSSDNLVLSCFKCNINRMHDNLSSSDFVPRGEEVWSAKLAEDDVVMIRERLASGEHGSSLAVEYNVCKDTIYKLARKETWKHV